MHEFDFFLSHNKAQKDWTAALAEGLRKKGSTVFFAEDSIAFGEDIVAAIEKGLNRSRQVILILSKGSVKSRWVEMEWASSLLPREGYSYPKLVPILLEDCDIPLLLQRLNYIDARDGIIESVIKKLLENLIRSPKSNFRKVQITQLPVPFGSPQYVERVEDSRLRTILERGGSVYLYGPRRIGKTSMMQRVLARESLLENETLWLDLGGVVSNSSEDLLENIAWVIANRVGKRRKAKKEPTSYYITNIFRELCSSSKFTLLIDEVDLFGKSPTGVHFLNILRQIISDPRNTNFRCVCAGFLPPWKWGDDLTISPWWNMFHPLRLSSFTLEETRILLELVGVAEFETIQEIFNLTGGHPQLVSSTALEIEHGASVDEVLKDPMRLDGPFAHIVLSLVDNAVSLAGGKTDFLYDLITKGELKKKEEMESLWEAGLILNPDNIPPQITGSIFMIALNHILKQNDENSNNTA